MRRSGYFILSAGALPITISWLSHLYIDSWIYVSHSFWYSRAHSESQDFLHFNALNAIISSLSCIFNLHLFSEFLPSTFKQNLNISHIKNQTNTYPSVQTPPPVITLFFSFPEHPTLTRVAYFSLYISLLLPQTTPVWLFHHSSWMADTTKFNVHVSAVKITASAQIVVFFRETHLQTFGDLSI